MTKTDLGVFLVATGLSATLAVLVHPLFWSIAVLAVAWLMGRDPQSSSP